MPAGHLKLDDRIHWQRRIIKHDQWVIRTRKCHKPGVVKWHRAQLRWTRRELKESLSAQWLLLQRLQLSILRGVCTTCWDNVAYCETGGTMDWATNTGNGFYGGLQFTHDTWGRNGGHKYASEANLATREQQIKIASTLGLSNWPTCGTNY